MNMSTHYYQSSYATEWIGQVIRRGNDNAKTALHWTTEGKRKSGR
jgi:hypothetical protein